MYKNTGIKIKVINEIYNLAMENEIQKVILFGSRARGIINREGVILYEKV